MGYEVTKDNLFGYHASTVLPAVAAGLTGISLVAHYWQNTRYDFWRVTFFLFYGSLFYTIGWVLRAVASTQPGNFPLFLIQNIFVYLAPPVFSAAEYNIMGRLMHYLPMHAAFNPNRVVYIFVFLGSLVEIFTAIGAAWVGSAPGVMEKDLSNARGLIMDGTLLMCIAVVLQAVVELAFMGLIAHLHLRAHRARMLPRNVRALFLMLYGTATLIIVRCAFRAVENFQNRHFYSTGAHSGTSLLRVEWPLYVLEALPVVLYSYWLNFIHPGRFLPNNQRQYLDFDGQTERMGPGWVHKRHPLMFVADPFNFIGMLTIPKREKFYLEPLRWPVVNECFAQGTGSNVGVKANVGRAQEESSEDKTSRDDLVSNSSPV